jgi:hypothetical protein
LAKRIAINTRILNEIENMNAMETPEVRQNHIFLYTHATSKQFHPMINPFALFFKFKRMQKTWPC